MRGTRYTLFCGFLQFIWFGYLIAVNSLLLFFFSIQADEKCYKNPSSSISKLLFTSNTESRISEATTMEDLFCHTNAEGFFLSLIVIN